MRHVLPVLVLGIVAPLMSACGTFDGLDPEDDTGQVLDVGDGVSDGATDADGCEPGLTPCADFCVDLNSSSEHCGACGSACPVTHTCVNGSCQCPPGFADCDGDPVNGCEIDTSTSDDHCGACGVTCSAALNKRCVGGACLCAAGFDDCDEDPSNGCEADLLSDATTCGSCTPCETLPTCTDGRCTCGGERCNADQVCCEGASVGCGNLMHSPLNCGGCGVTCRPGEICLSGECVCAGEGEGECAPDEACCDGECVDPTDGQCACGGGAPCGVGEACCDGVCVDLTSDREHCGRCGTTCDPGSECLEGACGCPGDQIFCQGQCVDAKTNDEHCGACGNDCRARELCCDGACVDPNVSDEHCGGCFPTTGLRCDRGTGCCGGACTPLGDVTRCAACNDDCTALPGVAQVECRDLSCVVVECLAGFMDCDGDGTNGCEAELAQDPDNCGACGHDCGDGEGCDNGRCQCHYTNSLGNPATRTCDPGETCDADDRCVCGGIRCGETAGRCVDGVCMCGDGPACDASAEQECQDGVCAID